MKRPAIASPGKLYVAQSATAYAVRAPAVVDSSLVAAWLFGEPRADEALACMEGRELLAPILLDYELANVGVNKVRQGLVSADAAREVLARAGSIGIVLHHIDSGAVAALALRYGLSAYDASYLWLAEQHPAPLFTFDKKLGNAARDHFA